MPIPRRGNSEFENQKMCCELCNKEGKIIQHHISYFPEKTIYVCTGCHSKLHHDINYYPECQPPENDAAIFYGTLNPTTPIEIKINLINGIKCELLEIQNLLGLTDVNETIRFIINQYYKQIKLDKVWWK